MNFLEKYKKAREEKNSSLCIGLDPAIKEQRKENIIPEKYFSEGEVSEGILNFSLDIVEKTAPYAIAFKMNSQYVLFSLNIEQLKKLNEKIHESRGISILDHKLNDINESNLSALFWIKEAAFDALTFSPFSGNIGETVKEAHKFDLGIFVLTLMSNKEAIWIQKNSESDNVPLFLKIAKKSKVAKADGIVIGATDHVTKEDIEKVRKIVDRDTIFLCPGIGFQQGDLKKFSSVENLLINVGRAIIYDKNPERKAEEFRKMIDKFLYKLS